MVVRDASGAVPPRAPRPRRLLPVLVIVLTAGAIWAMATVSPESAPEVPPLGPPEGITTSTVATDRLAAGWQETLVIGAGAFDRVVVGANALVAVGASDGQTFIYLTSNGEFWEEVGDRGFVGGRIGAAVAVGEGFVVAGGLLGPGGYYPAVWSAIDGREWTREMLPSSGPGYVADLVVTESGLLALGSEAFVEAGGGTNEPHAGSSLWVFDESGWRPAEGQRPLLADLVVVGDLFVGGGRTEGAEGKARLWVSPDGESWVEVRGTGNRWPEGMTFTSVVELADGTVVAAATRDVATAVTREEGESSIFRSEDLLTWERLDNTQGPDRIARLIPVRGGLVATIDDFTSLFWTSSDGEDWHPVLLPESPLRVNDVVEWGCRDLAVGWRGGGVGPNTISTQATIWWRGCDVEP